MKFMSFNVLQEPKKPLFWKSMQSLNVFKNFMTDSYK